MFGIAMGLQKEHPYKDRREAGRALAAQLSSYADRPDVLVLALPRGGVPVAYEVALALRAPMDLFLARKLDLPGHENLAAGAVASGGLVVLNTFALNRAAVSAEKLDITIDTITEEMERATTEYRGRSPEPAIQGQVVILVDDGLVTGSTVRAALRALRLRNPQRLVVAVPVGASSTCLSLRNEADEIVCASTPEPFRSVGFWYENFEPTSGEEVRHLLEEAHSQRTRQEVRAVL